jgi:hypothetical protein
MEQGFIPETTRHSQNVDIWVEGLPEKSFWSGIKTRGLMQHKIESWRCQKCGFLENYAPAQ